MAMFTREQLVRLVELQKSVNDLLTPGWLESDNTTLPYYRAAYMEAAEALDWVGWKWWANVSGETEWAWNKDPDSKETQTLMEVVDILHFVISDFYRECVKSHLSRTGTEAVDYLRMYEVITSDLLLGGEARASSKQEFIAAIEEFMHQCLRVKAVSILSFTLLIAKLGINPSLLFKIYIGKNVLNKFRYANGYKEGTYNKIIKGKEDNYWLLDYLLQQEGEVSEYDIQNFLNGLLQDGVDPKTWVITASKGKYTHGTKS